MAGHDPERAKRTATNREVDTTQIPTEQDELLAEVVRRVVAELQPQKIYLFGSRARGDGGPDSDYDLLVIVPASDLAPHRRDLLAFRALSGVAVAKDVLVLTHDEFVSRSRAASSLPSTVLREGRLLYAA